MKLKRTILCATFLATVAVLAGCGGSQPPTGAPAALAQTSALTTPADRSKSWMLSEAQSAGLLYVAANGQSYVLSYPQGKILATISPGANGACSDRKGNVFLTENGMVAEYAHGGTTPVTTFSIPGIPIGCAVDPADDNLAVTVSNYDSKYSAIMMFPGETGTPKTYDVSFSPQFCGYDNHGDLFVDGYGGPQFTFAELRNGSGSFTAITFQPSNPFPGQVQWDGHHITVESIGGNNDRSGPIIYRLKVIASQAMTVGETHFIGPFGGVEQSWIHGDRIFITYAHPGNSEPTKVGVWKYPEGGKPIKVFKHIQKFGGLNGIAFSAG